MDADPDTAFRHHAKSYWESVAAGLADQATAHTQACEAVVERWPSEQRDERLRQLLGDEDDGVRYAAAAILGPEDERSIATLKDLSGDQAGLIAPTARLLLMQWQSRS